MAAMMVGSALILSMMQSLWSLVRDENLCSLDSADFGAAKATARTKAKTKMMDFILKVIFEAVMSK